VAEAEEFADDRGGERLEGAADGDLAISSSSSFSLSLRSSVL
jgi:hypothetical protein